MNKIKDVIMANGGKLLKRGLIVLGAIGAATITALVLKARADDSDVTEEAEDADCDSDSGTEE